MLRFRILDLRHSACRELLVERSFKLIGLIEPTSPKGATKAESETTDYLPELKGGHSGPPYYNFRLPVQGSTIKGFVMLIPDLYLY